jgi:hypothetical protein
VDLLLACLHHHCHHLPDDVAGVHSEIVEYWMVVGDVIQVALMVEVVVKQLHNHLHQMMGETVANEPGDLMVIGTWTLTVLVLTETEF